MDAIILAGGRSRRLGRPKEDARVGGRTLLRHTIDACPGARRVVVVGPRRVDLHDARVVQVQEDPPLGGPVAAIAAALEVLGDDAADDLLVLACDMPRVAEVVATLPRPSDDEDACLALDGGRVQPLAGCYRRGSLQEVLRARPVENASMRSVVDDLRVRAVVVPSGSTDDVDTPDDLIAARRQAHQQQGEQS